VSLLSTISLLLVVDLVEQPMAAAEEQVALEQGQV
jgi:hypothetical protein